ncbi:MAG TPA: DUF1800 domain-containing protein, partial [Sphingorhabdus sp.]|nr:DUF1800 domain-containing protein [Sphingorhabdus sp.]
MTVEAAIAHNRFGLGLRPRESGSVNSRSMLKNQLASFDPAPPSLLGQPTRAALATEFREYQLDRRERRSDMKAAEAMAGGGPQIDPAKIEKVVNTLRQYYVAAADARINTALASGTGFPERLVHFWSNHFAVSIDKLPVLALAGDFEFNAIRPNIMGKFSDLLFAAVTHPAMLLYLDQAQSIGPKSPLAERFAQRRTLGLNENLAREVLELHTLGVRTVYSQNDVTELARALTGYTVGGMAKGPLQRFMAQNGGDGDMQFFGPIHEPGDRQIVGRRYAQQGAAQARAILSDLATHPATARHVATKLAAHFVADDPPATLVTRLEQSFLKSGGDLLTVYGVLIDAPEAWAAQPAKFKSPWDWVISSLRALDIRDVPGREQQAVGMFAQLGQT